MSTEMAQRFQPARWSTVRLAIHGLKPGESMRRPMADKDGAHCSVDRFNDAYDGERVWEMSSANGIVTVTRTK